MEIKKKKQRPWTERVFMAKNQYLTRKKDVIKI